MEDKIVIIDFDDAHPEDGFGLEMDKGSLVFIKKLNSTFGAKITLFVPYNYNNKYPLYKYPEFVNYLKRLQSFGHEIACHGLYHRAKDELLGSREFLQYDILQTDKTLSELKKGWNSLGFEIKGIRYPGWGETKFTEQLSYRYFDYIASHIIGEEPIIGFNGIYKLPYNLSIENLYDVNQKVYFIHGHIGSDERTKNNLNIQTYINLVAFISKLDKKYNLKFMTYSEYLIYIKNKNKNR